MAIQNKPAQAILNRSHLSEMSFGDEDFEKEIIGDFLEAAPRLLQDMSQAAESGSCKLMAMASHTLKGSCSSLGVEQLAATCQELEHVALASDLADAGELIQVIGEQLDDFRALVSKAWSVESWSI